MSSTFSFPEETYILIGEVTKAQGIRGELKIHSFAGQPENLRQYKSLMLIGKTGEISAGFPISTLRIQGTSAIVGLQGIGDRNTAELYVGHGVLITRQDLPMPQDGEFYWRDVEGRKVITRDGRKLGTVSQLFSNGAQDIMVVTDGELDYMIPLVAGIVISTDHTEIVIDPPEGLLEINSSLDD
jgi:16S rRNA processing protein RimM